MKKNLGGLVTFSFLVSAAAVPTLGSCSNSSFKSTAPASTSKTTPVSVIPAKESGAATSSAPIAKQATSDATPSKIPDVPATNNTPSDLCSRTGGVKHLLILDLKSGWFAGDGGQVFKKFTISRCPEKVDMVYAHVTASKIEGNFTAANKGKDLFACLGDKFPVGGTARWEFQGVNNCILGDISRFDSVWIFSGSELDGEDLTLAAPFFNSLQIQTKKLAATKPLSTFFFGAGMGNISHSNAIAKSLFGTQLGSDLFKPWGDGEGSVLPDSKLPTYSPAVPLIAGDGKAVGTFDQKNTFFHGMDTLFDYGTDFSKFKNAPNIDYFFRTGSGNCLGDHILTTVLATLATDACNLPVIASGKVESHRIFAEGNMARFYGTTPEQYFNHIANLLLQ